MCVCVCVCAWVCLHIKPSIKKCITMIELAAGVDFYLLLLVQLLHVNGNLVASTASICCGCEKEENTETLQKKVGHLFYLLVFTALFN